MHDGGNADHEDGGYDDSGQDEFQRFTATEIAVAVFAGLHAKGGCQGAAHHLDWR